MGHKCHPVTFRLYRATHFDSYIFIHILQSKSQKSPSPNSSHKYQPITFPIHLLSSFEYPAQIPRIFPR